MFFLLVIPSILIFGSILRIFERPMRVANMDYDFIGNSFWNAIVVMTTVGYGDVYPVTTSGRVANAFCAFCGGIILPMAFVTIGSVLHLKDNEQQASRSIRLSSYAAQSIVAALKYNLYLSKNQLLNNSPSNLNEALKNPLYSEMKNKLMIFRKWRMSMPIDTTNVIQVYQNMKRKLDLVEKNFVQLNELVNSLVVTKNN